MRVYTQYLEDMPVGAVENIGAFTFTTEAIIAYARAYDPSPLHCDEAAAQAGPFGALTASPLHVANIWMRLLLEAREGINQAYGPSPGFFDWVADRPVHAGETIRYRSTLQPWIALKSRPQWGISRSLNEAFNEKGDRVWHFTGQGLVLRRPKEGEQASWEK